MATYTNWRCGQCGATLTGGYQLSSGWKSRIGVPIIRCLRCGYRNSTGNTPWSKMTAFGRGVAVFRSFCLGLVASAFALAFMAMIAMAFVGQQAAEEMLGLLAIPALILGYGYTFWTLKKAIDLVEQAVAEGNETDPPINL